MSLTYKLHQKPLTTSFILISFQSLILSTPLLIQDLPPPPQGSHEVAHNTGTPTCQANCNAKMEGSSIVYGHANPTINGSVEQTEKQQPIHEPWLLDEEELLHQLRQPDMQKVTLSDLIQVHKFLECLGPLLHSTNYLF